MNSPDLPTAGPTRNDAYTLSSSDAISLSIDRWKVLCAAHFSCASRKLQPLRGIIRRRHMGLKLVHIRGIT